MTRRHGNAGFTLVEVLIATTLVMALTTGVLIALRVGIDAMTHADTKLMHNRRVMAVERILEAQVSDIVPAMTTCQPRNSEDPAGQPIAFFQGEPQTMRFITSYSLNESSRGLPQLLEYQVIPGEHGEGVRLVVNEHLYSGPLSARSFCSGTRLDETLGAPAPVFSPVQIGPGSFVIADRLAACHFEFLQPDKDSRQKPSMWVPRWVRPLLPDAIRVVMGPLDPGASQLPLATLTIPVPVNRDPSENYATD
jgi:general secretion pathway protein J